MNRFSARFFFALVVVFGFFLMVDSKQCNAAEPYNASLSYTVVRGDNLWKIAEENYGNGVVSKILAKINKIKNPDIIQIGSAIRLPDTVKIQLRKKYEVFNRCNEVERVLITDYRGNENSSQKVEVEKKSNSIVEKEAPKPDAKIDESKMKEFIINTVNAAVDEKEQRRKMDEALRSAENKSLVITNPIDASVQPIGIHNTIPVAVKNQQDGSIEKHTHDVREIENLRQYVAPIDHQFSFGQTYLNNKSDEIKAGTIEYTAWMKKLGLYEGLNFGIGAFGNAWENKNSMAQIRTIMPGMHLRLEYDMPNQDNLSRLLFGKLMIGEQIQSVRKKPTAAKTIIEPENDFRIGTVLGGYYQVNPQSEFQIINENWFSVENKKSIQIDPAFSLIASHRFTSASGNIDWRFGLGPQYEDWSKTWRLHVYPIEMSYKNFITAGIFANFYPWDKGELYSKFLNSELTSLGAFVKFNTDIMRRKENVLQKK